MTIKIVKEPITKSELAKMAKGQFGEKVKHTTLASGRWFKLSLAEQLANVGSEISRAIHWQKKDKQVFWGAVERAFELLDLTIEDPRWRKRLKELTRVREILADAILGGREYDTRLEDLERYFFYFALAARAS